jgi:hypothetical protein
MFYDLLNYFLFFKFLHPAHISPKSSFIIYRTHVTFNGEINLIKNHFNLLELE